MVAVNVQRTGNGAADQVHDHRHPCAGLYRKLLQHVQVTLRAGSVEYAAAGCRSTVADARGAVLAVGRNQHDIMLSAGFHRIKELRNLRGRGNREVPHDVIIDLVSGISRHFVAGFI
ncbi:hypothetical protein D3C73_1183830 [compost metagenome]